jgi:uncharacterized protein YciI
MKSINVIIAVLLAAIVFHTPASAQVAPGANPNFDEALAKKLGADDLGMREYVMCFLKTGPFKVEDPAKRSELMKGHFGMINRLAKEGKLVLAGPFSNGGEFRGIYLFDVKTVEEAKLLTETDPSIKVGYFTVEFIKWYGSAALMQVNETHNKIAKKNL